MKSAALPVILTLLCVLPAGLHAAAASAPIAWDDLGAKAGAQYHGDALNVTATGEGAHLTCGFQRIEGTVTSEGLWLTSTVGEASGARFHLAATALGRGVAHAAALPLTGRVRVAESGARWERPGLVEEYSVSVDGMRQDFVIARRLAGAGELRVELALSGARAEAAGYGAKLTLDDPHRVLAYSRLRVVDATGRDIHATLKVLDAERLVVCVEDEDASYPLRVDPTFSDANWVSLNSGVPGASAIVWAAVIDGSGNLYIGGQFTVVGTLPANGIAKWNGSAWSALGTGMNSDVYALAVSGTTLYAGGNFTTAAGASAKYIAQWNGSTWSALGTGMNNNVYALAMSGSTLYAGGSFTAAGGVANTACIAKWNGTVWSALGTGGMGGAGADGYGPYVAALAVNGTSLYAGGDFTTAGGVSANYIAKWSGTAWSALGAGISTAGSDGNGPYVYTLAVSGSTLYAGGDFTTAGAVTANSIAQWSGTAWTALGSTPGMDGEVESLAVSGTTLYAGGNFTTAGGVAAGAIAKWNGSVWSACGSGLGGIGFDGNGSYVSALIVSGTTVYAGGDFTTAGAVTAASVARWDGSNWSSLGLGSGMNGDVNAFAVIGSTLYVGGNFTTAPGGVAVNYITQWNGTAWAPLGTGMDSDVQALAVIGTTLYAGGDFTTAGGVTVNQIAQWNGSIWSALGTTPGMGGAGVDLQGPYVSALAVSGTTLYAGGDFTTAGGVAANYIAKWNGSAWSALGAGISVAGIDGKGPYVSALAVSGSTLYAGGDFTKAGIVIAKSIAQWNGNTWSALGATPGMSGIGAGGYGPYVNVLTVSGTTLYAGGDFATAGGVANTACIAQWNGTGWSPLGTGMDGAVYSLAVSGSTLYVGGSFTTAGGVAASCLAQWNGSSWSAMGTGTDGGVYALAALGTNLYLGGDFAQVGTSTVSPYIVQAALAPPVVTANTADLAAGASSIVITGTGFDPQAANNSVVFNDGASGTVMTATPTSLTVTFSTHPSGAGALTAVVATDGYTSGSAVQVANVLTWAASWRLHYFGTTANTGNAADTAMPQNDGITNLMKFATGMDPTKPGVMPGTLSRSGNNLVFTYTPSAAAVADGVTFTVEYSDTLNSGSWLSDIVNQGVIGAGGNPVTASVPMGSNGHRFAHLKIKSP